MSRRTAAALALAVAASAVAGSVAGCADDGGGSTAAAGDQGGSQAPVVLPAEPIYPDSVQGLESLMTALVKALQDDDATEKSRLLMSLQLPDPRGWFQQVFGAQLAPRLVAEHERTRSGIGWLASHIKGRIDTGLVVIHAERFEAPGQSAAVGYQSAALAKMVQRVPLYSVRFSTPDGNKTWHVWSFVHQHGTFRYVGKMRKVESRPPPGDGRDPLEYRLGDAARVKASARTR
jgi:hypothetical protein